MRNFLRTFSSAGMTTNASNQNTFDEKELKDHLFSTQEIEFNTPYRSVKDFDELNLPAGLVNDLYMAHFDQPSFIQGEALPRILDESHKSLLAQSQNGTGKTLAFVLGLLARIEKDVQQLQAICILNTRELVIQTFKDYIVKLTQTYKVNTCCLLRNPPEGSCKVEDAQVILTTPMQLDSNLESLHINAVRIIVIDEADSVLENKTFNSFFNTLFQKLTRAKTQFLFFTATITQKLHDLISKYIPEDKLYVIRVSKEESFIPTNKHCYINVVDDQQKVQFLKELFPFIQSSHTFIFVKTKNFANDLSKMLKEMGFESQFFSSELRRIQRDDIIQKFKDSKIHVLICTDVVSRGVDIPAAKAVVNFDIPDSLETYMHRQGRTGRFARHGIVINFITPDQMKFIDTLRKEYNLECKEIFQQDFSKLNQIAQSEE